MMTINLKDEKGAEFQFSPPRDVAYFFPQLLDAVGQVLDPDNWGPELRALYSASGYDEVYQQQFLLDLMAAYKSFTRAFELVAEPTLTTPHFALEKAGFYAHPHACQIFILMTMGQVMAGTAWYGARDSMVAGKPARFWENGYAQVRQGLAEALRLRGQGKAKKAVQACRVFGKKVYRGVRRTFRGA